MWWAPRVQLTVHVARSWPKFWRPPTMRLVAWSGNRFRGGPTLRSVARSGHVSQCYPIIRGRRRIEARILKTPDLTTSRKVGGVFYILLRYYDEEVSYNRETKSSMCRCYDSRMSYDRDDFPERVRCYERRFAGRSGGVAKGAAMLRWRCCQKIGVQFSWSPDVVIFSLPGGRELFSFCSRCYDEGIWYKFFKCINMYAHRRIGERKFLVWDNTINSYFSFCTIVKWARQGMSSEWKIDTWQRTENVKRKNDY